MKDPAILVKNRNQITTEQVEKYGYTFCQFCETSNCFKFHVHHIVFRSERPQHPNLHGVENLIIVCNKCHDKLHNNKALRNKLLIERNLNKIFNLNPLQ